MLEVLPALLLATTISVFAGYLFNSAFTLGDVVGVLIITPAILGAGGDIGTSFGARITTNLHAGLIEPRFGRFRLVYINFLAMFFCGMIVAVLVGILGFFIGSWIAPGELGLFDFLFLSLTAGAIEFALILALSLFIAFITFRHGLDPDNLIAPLITTVADLIGIAALFFILKIIV